MNILCHREQIKIGCLTQFKLGRWKFAIIFQPSWHFTDQWIASFYQNRFLQKRNEIKTKNKEVNVKLFNLIFFKYTFVIMRTLESYGVGRYLSESINTFRSLERWSKAHPRIFAITVAQGSFLCNKRNRRPQRVNVRSLGISMDWTIDDCVVTKFVTATKFFTLLARREQGRELGWIQTLCSTKSHHPSFRNLMECWVSHIVEVRSPSWFSN